MSAQIPLNNRVLVVDDNDAIHKDFRKILGSDDTRGGLASLESALFGNTSSAQASGSHALQIDSAMQGEEGFTLARNARRDGHPYAMAFIDMRMPPGWDGLRTIKEIWQADPDLNVVICTAFSDHSWSDIEATAGDGDRLLVLKKPFEPIEVRRLAATLTAKWTMSQRAALKMAELEELVSQRTTELRHTATHDKLTGLPNRRLFNDRLTQALEASRRTPDSRIAVLFIDFDRFKWVNDSLGHEAGDLVLQAVGQRLNNSLRSSDSATLNQSDCSTTARLGGDEFCILLTGLTSDDAAAVVATRILDELAKPYDILGQQIHSTASIGIAVGSSAYKRAEDLLRDADTAMYRAKAEGRGRFIIFDKAMHDQAVRRLTIEGELRRGVERGEFRTHYQPIVSLDTGELIAAEALVRWQHPERGLILPGEFIGVAEESGFINVLGLIILEASCRQLQEWKTLLPDLDLSVTVNISAKQLTNRDFCSNVDAILRSTGLDPTSLILEITETVLIDVTELTVRTLREIRDKGIRVYLDDFGTGYSSLSLLHTFQLDGLKIDRSFVKEAGRLLQYAAIIQAINDLSHKLGMEVIAEGVETPEQVTMLRSLNCKVAQGYLFSRPVPAADFELLLRDKSLILPKAIGVAA